MISLGFLLHFLLTTLLPTINCLTLPIDNGIKGEPIIVCGPRSIFVTIETEKPFAGKLYVKGFFHIPACQVNGNFSTTMAMEIPIASACGLRRSRMVQPRGIAVDSTVVLMFHPIFMTQVDKAYHVQCNYLEVNSEVTRKLDVSMRSPTELPQGIAQQDEKTAPTCKYEVLQEGQHGVPVTFATIGDTVYHKWSCESAEKAKYCMTVHSCSADDGQGMGQQLIDGNGCSLDSFLLKNLDYGDDLMAGQAAHVFKFADKPTIFFSCMIRLEFKEETSDGCTIEEDDDVGNVDGTMERNNYDEYLHFRKARASSRYVVDVDVTAPSVEVVELPEYAPLMEPSTGNAGTTPCGLQVCVPRLPLGLALTLLTFLVGISVFFYLEISSRIQKSESRYRQSLALPDPMH